MVYWSSRLVLSMGISNGSGSQASWLASVARAAGKCGSALVNATQYVAGTVKEHKMIAGITAAVGAASLDIRTRYRWATAALFTSAKKDASRLA